MSSKNVLTCAAVALAALCAVAQAAPQQSHACAGVIEAQARLACYDEAFPPVPGAKSDGADMEARRRQAVEEFGFSKHQLDERDPDRVLADPGRIQAKVASVTERSSGQRLVTLDSGQAWLLTETNWRGRLAAGDSVTVRQAALGTYMLVTSKGIALRARRER